tara:strand:- start:268 stop:1680 length:1413 start_codon:yes stop_codon:yes gene_type:complete
METLMAQQEAIRQNQARQQEAAQKTSRSITNRPRTKFLKEDQSFSEAFSDPSEAQRAFAFNAGLALLSSSGTNNLSQRIGQALGSGMQGMQEARQAEIDTAVKVAQANEAAITMQGQGLAQEVQFSRDIGVLRESQAQKARNEAVDAFEREKFEFTKSRPEFAPDVMTKRQERRRVLQASLAELTDPAAIEQVNQEIFEINAANAPKTILNPSTGIWERPSTMGSSKPTQLTKQTIDLTGSITGASQIAKQGMGLVYDPIQDEVFGRIQNFPTIAGAYESIRALGDPRISQFLEAKNRFRVSAMLPFARTLAPVTEIDAVKLEKTKGMLEAGDRNAQIKEWEGKSLPDLAQLIFDSNINYKVGDTGGSEGAVYGPQVAAQNQLIFAESSLNGALDGQGYTADQSMAEKNERTSRLLDMYPSTGVSRNLSGTNGVYSYKGKVVSQNFIDKISKGYGLTPADFIKYSEISAY